MDYFRKLLDLLKIEKEEDRKSYEHLTQSLSVTERRANGMTWYPIAIKDTEIGRGEGLKDKIIVNIPAETANHNPSNRIP